MGGAEVKAHTVTPRSLNKHVQRLCRHMRLTALPVRLTVSRPCDCEPGECFPNVERLIAREGGAIQYGWLLWERPGVMVEAEFHAVWRDSRGALREVTGSSENEPEVLFVPDDSRRYEGRRVDNVRLAVRDDRLVRDFIWCAEEWFRVTNKGDRASVHGEVPIPKFELDHFVETMGIAGEMLNAGMRGTDQCICGSGKKYIRCHSLRLPAR